MRTGRLHARHTLVCKVWLSILREAGYRVHVERLLRNTRIPVRPDDARRMDLVASPGARGAGARRGATLFCDITLSSPIGGNGLPRFGSHLHDGAAIGQAVDRHRRTYDDVNGNAALLVLGTELFGRWSADAVSLIRELAFLKAREAPLVLRKSVELGWFNRWWGLVGVGAQKAIAMTMMCGHAVDLLSVADISDVPSVSEILRDM
jgi:hypothetical protein